MIKVVFPQNNEEKDLMESIELGEWQPVKNIRIARHALAIDEKRSDFIPAIWQLRPDLDLKQV